MKIRLSFLILYFCTIALFHAPVTAFSQIYLDAKAKVDDRVNDLLGRMTLDEKIGQMVQTERAYDNVNTIISQYYLGSILSGGGSVPGTTPQSWITMYNGMQTAAMATRLKIPIIYGIDAVHGNNNVYGATIFPHNSKVAGNPTASIAVSTPFPCVRLITFSTAFSSWSLMV